MSPASAKNAVKILPGIARQLGDLAELKGKAAPGKQGVTVTEDGMAAQEPVHSSPPSSVGELDPIAPGDIAKVPIFLNQGATLIDLTKAIALRKERTKQHQAAVKGIAQIFANEGFQLFELPYDCLCAKAGSPAVLVEVKTLDGSAPDERRQAERALAQLWSYKFFDMPSDLQAPPPVLVAAFDKEPALTTIAFLRACEIRAAWQTAGGWMLALDVGSSDFEVGLLF